MEKNSNHQKFKEKPTSGKKNLKWWKTWWINKKKDNMVKGKKTKEKIRVFEHLQMWVVCDDGFKVP